MGKIQSKNYDEIRSTVNTYTTVNEIGANVIYSWRENELEILFQLDENIYNEDEIREELMILLKKIKNFPFEIKLIITDSF